MIYYYKIVYIIIFHNYIFFKVFQPSENKIQEPKHWLHCSKNILRHFIFSQLYFNLIKFYHNIFLNIIVWQPQFF
jgi:hypothetical protein